MNTLDGKVLVDRGRFLLYGTRRAVVVLLWYYGGIMEINFRVKFTQRVLKT